MSDPARPLTLRVVAGRPTPEELAALVVVLTGSGAPAPRSDPPARTGGWSAYWRTVGAPPPPGPDSWRRSGRPG